MTSTLPHGCGGCTNRWAGTSTAHCPTCHRTFGAVGGFDRHRRDGRCVDPATLGLVASERTGYTAWVFPISDAERARLNALKVAV